MQTSNACLKRSDDPVWYSLTEFSLSEFVSELDNGEKLTAGLLFHAVHELGMSPDCAENIVRTLAESVKGKWELFRNDGSEIPGRIRVFCQKKRMDGLDLAKNSRAYKIGNVMNQSSIFRLSGDEMNGGWGYFMIERSGGSADSSGGNHPFIDLYLYREGE